MATELETLMRGLEEHERVCQFTEFTNETALKIGMAIVERAQREKKGIVVDITRNGQCLFHCALSGTTPDNDFWIAGKNRMVNRFAHSSYYLAKTLEWCKCTVEERFHVSGADHFASGGGFPLLIRNVGPVGTITVSGMPDHMDHAYIVEAIKAHLGV